MDPMDPLNAMEQSLNFKEGIFCHYHQYQVNIYHQNLTNIGQDQWTQIRMNSLVRGPC